MAISLYRVQGQGTDFIWVGQLYEVVVCSMLRVAARNVTSSVNFAQKQSRAEILTIIRLARRDNR